MNAQVDGVRRLIEPGDVASVTIMGVATLGIAVNGITALLLASGRKGDINVRGADEGPINRRASAGL